MGIDEIIKRATIELPCAITLDEAEKLIAYIAKQLPANINYKSSYFKSIARGQDGKMSIQDGTVNLEVTISSYKNHATCDTFQFGHSQQDISKFDAIIFQQVPGWDLSEYRPEVRELWGDVRKIVNSLKNKMHLLLLDRYFV